MSLRANITCVAFLSILLARLTQAQVQFSLAEDAGTCLEANTDCNLVLQINDVGPRTEVQACFQIASNSGMDEVVSMLTLLNSVAIDMDDLTAFANTLLNDADAVTALNERNCALFPDEQFRDLLFEAITLVSQSTCDNTAEPECFQCVSVALCAPGNPFFGPIGASPSPSPTKKAKFPIKPPTDSKQPFCSPHSTCFGFSHFSRDPKCCLEKCLCKSGKPKKQKKVVKCLTKCVKGKKGPALCAERAHLCAHPIYNNLQTQACCVAGCGCNSHVSKKATKACVETCFSPHQSQFF